MPVFDKVPCLLLRILPCATCLCLCLIHTGCVSKRLRSDIEDQRASIAREVRSASKESVNVEVVHLNWKEAVRLVKKRNLGLQQSRQRVERLRRAKRQQWRNWLPRLGVNLNVFSSLKEAKALHASNTSTAITMPLVIPNPYSARAKAFANALSYYEARGRQKLDQRQVMISLHQLFLRHARLVEQHAVADKGDDQDLLFDWMRGVESEISNAQSMGRLQAQLVDMLNMPGKHIIIDSSTRANIDYSKRMDNLMPGKNYGDLAINLSALQIVGAMLRERGIEYTQLPSLSVGASTPSLYNSARDDSDPALDSDQILLFGGLSKTYDLTGRSAETINNARENTKYIKNRLSIRLDLEGREWKRLKQQYGHLLMKRKVLNERLEGIKKQQVGPAANNLNAIREIRRSLMSLDEQKDRLDAEIWKWDDNYWRKHHGEKQ